MEESLRRDRRNFLRQAAVGAGALWVSSLQDFAVRKAFGAPYVGGSPYGPISPVLDETTGLPLLQLPQGFRYMSYGMTGDIMSDGVATPSLHDGMSVVKDIGRGSLDGAGGQGRHWRVLQAASLLVERVGRREHGSRRIDGAEDAVASDHRPQPRAGRWPSVSEQPFDHLQPDRCRWHDEPGVRRRQRSFEKSWSTLAGTIRNCAGGASTWDSWVTCEETGDAGHGWCFDVGRYKGDPTALTAMGRFSHEGMMFDPYTGWVYRPRTRTTAGCISSSPPCAAISRRVARSTCSSSRAVAERSRWGLPARHDVALRVGEDRRSHGGE